MADAQSEARHRLEAGGNRHLRRRNGGFCKGTNKTFYVGGEIKYSTLVRARERILDRLSTL